MSRRYRHHMGRRATAGTIGCAIALLLGAILASYHLFRPRPLPYRPFSPINPKELPGSIERMRMFVLAEASFLAVIGLFSVKTDGERSSIFWVRLPVVGERSI